MNDDRGYGRDEPEEIDPLVSVEAEAALLGAMLIDNRLIAEFADRLRPTDFGEALHERIFSAMLRFAAKGALASPITLRPVFQMDAAAQHGDYLDRLADSDAATVGAADFVNRIVDFAARRLARDAMDRATGQLQEDFETPLGEITGQVAEAVWAAESRGDEIAAMDVREMIGVVQERDSRIRNTVEAERPGNLFVTDLDKVVGPLQPFYIIIAGRPGMGKSVLASSTALGYAAAGVPGLYIHAEMTREQMAMRVASDLSFAMGRGLAHDDILNNRLSAGDLEWLEHVKQRAKLLPLRFVPIQKNPSARRVYSLVARHKAFWAARGQKLGFTVVDYLGLLEMDVDGKPIEDDRKRMNAVSKVMMRIRDDLETAVFALAQLSRAVEGRAIKKPVISDLKETGNLEQDCDVAVLLYREEAYLEDSEPKRGMKDVKGVDLHEVWEVEMNAVRGKIDLIGGKHRHAKKRTRTGNFHGKYFAIRGGDVHDDGFSDPLLV